MTTIESIKLFLDENTNIESKIAGTGSLYIEFNDTKIRISDHEANYSAPRAEADKSFYTRNIDNKTFSAGDILFEMMDWMDMELGFDFSNDLKVRIYELED